MPGKALSLGIMPGVVPEWLIPHAERPDAPAKRGRKPLSVATVAHWVAGRAAFPVTGASLQPCW